MLCEQAGAAAKEVPLYKHIGDLAGNAQFVLPMPCFNVINGGVHSGNYLAPQGRQPLFLVLRKHRLSASCLNVNHLFPYTSPGVQFLTSITIVLWHCRIHDCARWSSVLQGSYGGGSHACKEDGPDTY